MIPKIKMGRPKLRMPARTTDCLKRRYIIEGLSVRDIARLMKISEGGVKRRLKAAGIQARLNVKRSRLPRFNQGRLFASIAENGIKGTAAKWRISERTLERYLARLRALGMDE